MPNGDHQQSTWYEKRASKVFALLDELDGLGKPDPAKYGNGYDKRAYGNYWDSNTEDLEALETRLAARLRHIRESEFADLSLEMQIWWRDYKDAMTAKEKEDARMTAIACAKEIALAKLTPEERALLKLEK